MNNYQIRVHRGSHSAESKDRGHPMNTYRNEVDACNALLAIGHRVMEQGGSIAGGGFILYATMPDGVQLTYRVWRIA